jgi:hypothetical protein
MLVTVPPVVGEDHWIPPAAAEFAVRTYPLIPRVVRVNAPAPDPLRIPPSATELKFAPRPPCVNVTGALLVRTVALAFGKANVLGDEAGPLTAK